MNSSIHIKQFRYCRDNFSYLLHIEQDALVIDGGAVDDILHLLAAHDLSLKYVLNTHSHYDHTPGNNSLLGMTGADFIDCRSLAEQGEITLADRRIQVIATPGHTDDSISFYTGSALIAGDTLFNGTVGNCFSGNMKAFFCSIRTLLELPDETVVYAGHDYVHESMSFARMLEPDNPAIDQYLKRYNPEHVSSTIEEEKRMNPFVRFDNPAIIEMLQQRELPCGTSYQRWCSLMSIEE
jgi:hydroxyacylglutathione hydrolase